MMSNALKILIAEDDANIALALEILLRRAVTGALISTAGDGQEALEQLQKEDYVLLLSDWNMPHMTGMELLIRLRAEPRTRELPFLMLTARTDLESAKALLSGTATDHIGKPFDNDELVAKVIKLLGDKINQ